MALIVVLSVMNGFVSQVRDRMLSVVSHVRSFPTTVHWDWRSVERTVRRNPLSSRRRRTSSTGSFKIVARVAWGAGARYRAGTRTVVSEFANTVRAHLVSADEVNSGSSGWRARAHAWRADRRKVTVIAPQGQVTPPGGAATQAVHGGQHVRFGAL